MEVRENNSVVMTGGSFTADDTRETVTLQPRMSRSESRGRQSISMVPFDDTLSERNWTSGLCNCQDNGKTTKSSLCCCWCYHKYMVAMRLGEIPFMGLMPCATFGLRIKVRTLFGIKGNLFKDFLVSLFCEPCAVCQMVKELDHIGL